MSEYRNELQAPFDHWVELGPPGSDVWASALGEHLSEFLGDVSYSMLDDLDYFVAARAELPDYIAQHQLTDQEAAWLAERALEERQL